MFGQGKQEKGSGLDMGKDVRPEYDLSQLLMIPGTAIGINAHDFSDDGLSPLLPRLETGFERTGRTHRAATDLASLGS